MTVALELIAVDGYGGAAAAYYLQHGAETAQDSRSYVGLKWTACYHHAHDDLYTGDMTHLSDSYTQAAR